MTRSRDVFRIVGVGLVAVAVIGWSQQVFPSKPARDDQEYTIRTTSRLVLLDVSVKDSEGGFATGLKRENFRIYENGVLQTITDFSDVDVPVTIGLVVDESGSMRPKRQGVINAAMELVAASNPNDEIFVINFNEKARRGLPDILPFTDDREMLRAALWRGEPEGRTALYDAVEMGLHHLEFGRRDKKTLVIVSDGGDNISHQKFPELMDDVLRSLATIYTIGIFDDEDPDRNPDVLKQLAKVSGGTAYFPKTPEAITAACQQIAKEIRTRYTIGYIPSADGKPERHLKLVANAPGRDKLSVRTRTKYTFEAVDSK